MSLKTLTTFYLSKFNIELWTCDRVLRFHPHKKTDRHDITEILLKVALNTTHKPTNLIVYKNSNVNYKNVTTSLIVACLGSMEYIIHFILIYIFVITSNHIYFDIYK